MFNESLAKQYRNKLSLKDLGRLNKLLTKQYWVDTPIDHKWTLTNTDLIEAGFLVRSYEVSAVKYNRQKMNRMNYAQQTTYDKRLNEKKTVYEIFDASVCFSIPKLVYDYCAACGCEKKDEEKAKNEPLTKEDI